MDVIIPTDLVYVCTFWLSLLYPFTKEPTHQVGKKPNYPENTTYNVVDLHSTATQCKQAHYTAILSRSGKGHDVYMHA